MKTKIIIQQQFTALEKEADYFRDCIERTDDENQRMAFQRALMRTIVEMIDLIKELDDVPNYQKIVTVK